MLPHNVFSMVLTKEVWNENCDDLVEHIKNTYSELLNSRQRTKVKLRVLASNNGIPVYGVSVPRYIANSFLKFDSLRIEKSGLAIVLTAIEQRGDNNENNNNY